MEGGQFATNLSTSRRSREGEVEGLTRLEGKAGRSLLDRRKSLRDLRAKPSGDGLNLFEVRAMLTDGFADFSRKSFQALVLRGKFQYLIP